MSKLLTLALLLSRPLLCLAAAFSSTDYCTKNKMCREALKEQYRPHVGCNCSMKRGVLEQADNFAKFRQLMLDVHNKRRHQVAGGSVKNLKKAADMMVINWDMELEYLACCHGLSHFGLKIACGAVTNTDAKNADSTWFLQNVVWNSGQLQEKDIEPLIVRSW